MATKKTTTKTTQEEPLKEEVKGSSELNELKELLFEMKKSNEALLEQNKELQQKITIMENVSQIQPIQVGTITPNVEERVYVVHMCEMMGGLTTHITLSDTTRDLRRMGEIMTLTMSQFEELKGKYLHFFEKGILAIDAKNIELATMNHLPVYDNVTQSHYNPKIINDLGKMTREQLKDLYENLSYQNQQNVIGIWLNKCYNKDPNYLDREKLEFLSKLTGGTDFDDIIFELINNERLSLQKNAPVQKIGTV